MASSSVCSGGGVDGALRAERRGGRRGWLDSMGINDAVEGNARPGMSCHAGARQGKRNDQDSAVKPTFLTSGPQRLNSESSEARMACGALPAATKPTLARPSITDLSFSAAWMAVLAAVMTLAGVLAGAKKPNHSSATISA